MKFLNGTFDFVFRQLVLNRLMLFAAGDSALGDAASNLGGGAAPGGEPEIFDDNSGGDQDQQDDQQQQDDQADDHQQGDQQDDQADDQQDEQQEDKTDDQQQRDQQEGDDQQQKDQQQPNKDQQQPVKRQPTEEDKKVDAALKEAYKNDPKLQQFLKDNPSHRATFFKAAEINKIFPGGINEATRSKEWATELFKIDKLVYGNGPQDFKSKREFVNMLWNECLDKTGQPTGHFESIAELITSDTLENIASHLAQQPQLAQHISANLKPEQVQTAIEIVKRAAGLLSGREMSAAVKREGINQKKFGVTQDTSKMDPQTRAVYEENQRLKAEQQQRSSSEAATAETNFNKSIYDQYTKLLTPDIEKRMPTIPTGRGIIQKWFVGEVLSKVNDALQADEFFDAQLSAAARSGDRGQQHITQLADMMKTRALALVPAAADFVRGELLKTNVPNPGNRPGNQGAARGGGNERPRREPSSGSPGRLTRGSGRPNQSQVPADKRGTPLKSVGDYVSDANRILGIE